MALRPRRLRFYYIFLVVYFVFQAILLIVLRPLNEDPHTNAFKILEIYKELSVKLEKDRKVDDSGLHKIIHVKQMKSKSSMDITVISQCSSNHFSLVRNLFRAWKGPISVAVFSEVKNIERTLWDISQFIHCNNHRDFGMDLVVPFQVSYMRDYEFPYAVLAAAEKSVSCNSNYLPIGKQIKNYNGTSPYPVNLLRNVARMGTSTDYTLLIDIDMTPSSNLRSDFLNFIKFRQPNLKKAVYVVPVFETLPDIPTPLDKPQLIRAVASKQARPFYIVPCESCQKLTGYDEWLSSEHTNGTKVLYQVEWKHPWEPFFIAGRDLPNFDERFKQYGMNRVSQICEIYVAGFKFFVLDNVFLIHKGFKGLNDFHDSKKRDMYKNRRLYVRFKTEVRYKYPDSERRC